MTTTHKLTLTKVFNSVFIQFLNDVILIVPDNADIQTAKCYLETLNFIYPTCVIEIWFNHIYSPYKDVIETGDLVSFVINKDYKNDLAQLEDANQVLSVFEKLKPCIREMTEHNQSISVDYIRKISKLSAVYNRLVQV